MDIDRGSEWRRWDLHLHTPFTKKNDQFKGRTLDEKWNNFYSDIAGYVGDGSDPAKAVCAVAIADYLSTDNYSKVQGDDRLPSCIKLVLPNVEMRIIPVSKQEPVNIHCLFNPDIAGKLDEIFFSKLKKKYMKKDYFAIKSGLVRLGRDFSGDDDMPEDNAYLIGLEQFVVDADVLFELIDGNSELSDNTIVVVTNGTNDGASGARANPGYMSVSGSQLDATVQEIYQNSDMIFSSNPADVKYFSGEGTDKPDEVIRKCGSLKPCIWGCDAHCNDKIFEPDGRRYCWIKADPTFEGLKQIIYEPKDRVHIGVTPPHTKPDYNVIDRVEIAGSDWFSPEPIYFSNDLTCIIGGKSTGKSVLLHNIAMAVDGEQVDNEVDIAPSNVKKIDGFSVYWRDGICSAGKDSNRNIVYISQSYLNKLSDSEGGASEIEEIVKRVMMQDAGCATLDSEFKREASAKKTEVRRCVTEFLGIIDERNELIKSHRETGDEKAIESEIERLSCQPGKFTVDGITEDEIKTYQESQKKKRELEIRRDGIEKEIEAIEKTSSVVGVLSAETLGVSEYADMVSSAVSDVKKLADEVWLERRRKILEQARVDLDASRASIQDQESIINGLKPKIDGNELARRNAELIAEENEKLKRLGEINDKLRKNWDSYDEHLNALGEAVRSFGDIYRRYADAMNVRRASESDDDINISVKSVFLKDEFEKKIADIIDNRTLSRFETFKLNDVCEDDMCPENMVELIKSVTNDSGESLKIKKEYGERKDNVTESVLNDIINDWYKIGYEVTMDGDEMQSMSPGKKALVLLKFFICMSDSRCPILIDQPEDDLDNRSIYDELVEFIREKKKERQIIIVTHNANIVIGADAELVIVANQDGKNSKNEKHRIEYRGGAIENNEIVQGKEGVLNSKGIRDHICEILEGGEKAFSIRQHKYHLEGR